MSPGRTLQEVRAFSEAIGAPGYGGGMEPVESQVRENRTFYATRFSRRRFQRQLEEVAEDLGVDCAIDIRPGLLMCDVEVTATGEREQVESLMKYAIGLGASSNMGTGGGGGA